MSSFDSVWFALQALRYERAAKGSDFPFDAGSVYPCDDRASGSAIDRHYSMMDLWAASKIVEHFNDTGMRVHTDVGSRVDGFCTHLLASGVDFVEHIDVRDPGFDWPGFMWRQDDARTLAMFSDASTHSLSCLHVAEHIGLGRYGDDIDPDGMVKCMRSLARVLAPGGHLYFACPVGRQRVVFNAHRIASPSWVVRMFAEARLTLGSFAAVDDAGCFVAEARPEDYEGANYACGCFEFRKAAR